jgi:hypothetical protein
VRLGNQTDIIGGKKTVRCHGDGGSDHCRLYTNLKDFFIFRPNPREEKKEKETEMFELRREVE